MGIRESLKEQLNEEDLKLQNFVIEKEPEQEVDFDFEKEIYKPLRKYLIQREAKYGSLSIMDRKMIMELKIVLPDEKIKTSEDEWELQFVQKELRDYYGSDTYSWGNYLTIALELKIAFPNHRNDINLDQKAWEGMLEWANHLKKEQARFVHVIVIKQLVLLFPEKIDALAEKVVYEECLDILNHKYENKEWEDYVNCAACLKIIFPDRFASFEFDKKSLQKIKKILTTFSGNKNWEQFIEISMNLKIAVAEEIKITDKSIELTMPEKKKSHRQQIPPRPKRREH